MYKPYTKKATSDKMMRIIKRERFLSIIISGLQNGKVILERSNPTPMGMKRSDMDWHEANKTRFVLMHPDSEKALFDWKLKLISETEWLREPIISHKDGIWTATWEGTRKLRIYYDWLHHKKQLTVLRVLKYLYTPLYFAMHYLDGGALVDKDNVLFRFNLEGNDVKEFSKWTKDIFGYDLDFHPGRNTLLIHCKDKLMTDLSPIIREALQ